MEELAELIAEVGMDSLCQQLDLDCSFDIPSAKSLVSGQSSSFRLTGSDDIITQTRTQADLLKKDLEIMSRNPRAAKILKKVFAKRNNACINNMEDAIEAIETSTQTFERAGTEIKQLVETVKTFERQADTSTTVRETANIIRILDILIPKIQIRNPSSCSQNADEFESLHSLASLVEDLSSKDDLYYSTQKRQSLKSSAKIVSRTTNYLAKIKQSFSKFDQFCSRDKSYNREFIAAIGDMIPELAGLYRALGGFDAAQDITKHGDFVRKLEVRSVFLYSMVLFFFFQNNIEKLGDSSLYPVTLDCNSSSSSEVAASALDDLAKLIDEVGMDSLCSQLGLDCSF